jgi:hypothetical protein
VKVRKIDPAAVLKSRGGKRAEQHEEVVKALALLADDAALEITPEQGETATAIRGRFTRVAREEGKSIIVRLDKATNRVYVALRPAGAARRGRPPKA